MRLLFVTDFTEQFAFRLLSGIHQYAQQSGEHWVVCKMPSSCRQEHGFRWVVNWARDWHADVVIGQFEPKDNVQLFRKYGIVALAQDYITQFRDIPNITANYEKMGRMAATRFISRGFKDFAFFGNNGMCWSDSRRDGFRKCLEEAGYEGHIFLYERQRIENLWYYNATLLYDWLRSLPKPVAIMACDDNQGSILLEACHSLGLRVPADVAVIGVDNDPTLCNLSDPALSSIDVDIEKGGFEAAAMAKRMVEDPSFRGEDIVLQPTTIVSRVSSNVMATRDPAVHAALQYIGEQIDHKILVSDVLEHVPLSRRLLEQRFLKETGITIYQYITKLRIERFSQLLLSSNDSIANIAAMMDEPDAKNLSRRFQAVKGCTPSEYRKRKLRKLGV
jgi:LacI family transcriptional regulator